MKHDEDISYQMFETLYAQAKAAQDAGRIREAKQLYLLSGETLLKVAKQTQDNTKAALIRRADKLLALSDALVEPARSPKPAPSAEPAKEKRASDESVTAWQSSGKPNVRFDDIAGLTDVKESIRNRVILPRQHPDDYRAFKREVSGGILLYGPPGTGKTMIAKAIACEVDAEFYSVRCSDIVGKYFGEAEKNVKSLFDTARAAKQAVLFFDEFEALASHRGGHSTVMNRLVPELLSQMDGFSISDSNSLLFLAATNRPWDIDTAFLRPPRLTEKIHVGLPDYEARLFLVQRAFEGVPCQDELSFANIAELSEGYNAADIVSLCGAIKGPAIERSIKSDAIDKVKPEDVTFAMERVRSSVQRKDIEQIARWEQSQGV